MPYPHPIRLRGPWNFEVLEAARPALMGRTGRSTLPGDWGSELGADFEGRVRYARHFHRPASLDPHERAWVVVDGLDARGKILMNGRPLGEVQGYALSAEFDVTEALELRNELVLEVEMLRSDSEEGALLRPGRAGQAGGPIGEVRLEVRSSQFVRGLALHVAELAGQLQLSLAGDIVGREVGGGLAVVASCRGQELLYRETGFGRFDFSAHVSQVVSWPGDAPRLDEIEVRLIAGPVSVWHVSRKTAARTAMPNDNLGILPSSTILSEAIRDEAWYTSMDQGDRPLVQAVPADWADEVCPRLAHHPAITAWMGSTAEVARLSGLIFGRPWITREALITLVDRE